MPQETMTARERWLAVLNREKPDRVPMDYWTTEEAHQKLKDYLNIDDDGELNQYLHIDRPIAVGPKYIGPPLDEGEDVFGIRYQNVDYGTGVYPETVYNPLAQYNSVAEIEANYTWPDPDWWDYSTLPDQIAGHEDQPIVGGGSEPFLTYKELRGDAQAYMDLVLNPEMVHYCLDKLFGLCYENTRRIYETIPGQVTFTYIAEDLGTQEGLLISREHIREFLLPRMKRMMDLAHQAGAYVFHHSDGAIREVIPDMIEAGIDVLNPIQWRCTGMDREGLKRDFGDKLIFHGAVDNQYTRGHR